MQHVRVDALAPDPEVIARAAEVIRRGGLVVIPTETVYGLAANALDPRAVTRIFEAKGRPSFNPLIVHLADAGDLPRVARDIPTVATELATRFWPGPLTLVLHRQPVVPDLVTSGSDTVGVRVPAHAVALALIRAAGTPLAAPSANPFMGVSPTSADHVIRGLGDRVDMILDAGPTPIGIESSVVDLTTTPPRFLRPGGISREALAPVIPRLQEAPALKGAEVRPSPGLMARHYAPRCRLVLFPSDDVAAVLRQAEAADKRGERALVLVRTRDNLPPHALLRLMPNDAAQFGRGLYSVLHALDDEGIQLAFMEEPPGGDAWEAVRDRLRRATTPLSDYP